LIGKRSSKAIRASLERLPKGSEAYDQAYGEAMERIEGQIADSQELAKQVLSWITCARRPLITSEIRHALAVEEGESELDEENLPEIEDMVSVCAGLVTVDEESKIIRLVHYTTQDYFERTQRDWFPDVQRDIVTTCATYLSFDAFETGFCTTNKEFEERLRLNPLYDYAARNWGYHVRAASTEVERSVLALLDSEAKVSASSQAMMASGKYRYGKYSQEVPKNVTGVHLAAYFGLEEITSTLLKKGYQSDCKDTYGRTPLSWAAWSGHEAVVKLLLEKNVEFKDKDLYGRTPLLWAAENGHEAVVKLLLEKGAELESKDNKYNQTPLSWAAANGHEAVVKLLLEKGAEPESKDKNTYGRTPLLWAAENGHETVMKLLLEKGAELKSKDRDSYGRTPLLWAAASGYETVVKLLLEKGAELESKDKDSFGLTPLLWAAASGHETVVKLLLEKGAELESKDNKFNQTPLSWAAMNGHETVVKLLLGKGAEQEPKDSTYGQTPLSRAAGNGHEAVVKTLLAKDTVDPHSKDRYGQTPLLLASGNGHEAVVKLFLAKDGVDLNCKDKFGRTPLSWAARRGNSEIVKLLLKNYEEKGIQIRDENVDIATPPAADYRSCIICDICTSRIPDFDIHYNCGICSEGDFDICQECIASGALRFDQSHKLIKRTFEDSLLVEVPD
jgi:ankyrin repeat protein